MSLFGILMLFGREYRLGIVFDIEIWSKDTMLTSAVKIIGTQNQSI